MNLAVDHKDRDAYARIYYKSYTYFTKGMCRIVQESKEDKSVLTFYTVISTLTIRSTTKLSSLKEISII